MKTTHKGSLTLTAPLGAICNLYRSVPASANYFTSINPENAIKPTSTEVSCDRAIYHYDNRSTGIYHYGVSMEGYTAVCQIINYTEEKAKTGHQIDIELDRLGGNGYETGFIMLNTQEFIDAHLTSDRHAWGKRYDRLFNTPMFRRPNDRPGKHQQTTYEELTAFIADLDNQCEYMHVFSLGKSPKYGFDMPLVLFTNENVAGMTLAQAAETVRNNGKPTIQYTAQIHSNEPGSCEGALAMMLELAGEYGNSVLGKVDIYIVPRINLDGAVEAIREAPTTGEDMNRDYLFMHNKELRMLNSAYNLFLPEVAVDGHEKSTSVLITEESRCTDMEVQVGTGSLNHPAEMNDLAMKMALEAIGNGRRLSLRTHFYDNLASGAGGAAGSSYYGTRNSLSFLVETPGGKTFGRFAMERRVLAQYVLASTVIDYTVKHCDEVIKTVHESREKMARMGNTYDEANVIVLEHGRGETGTLATPMIHVPSGEITNPAYDIVYREHVLALRSRVRPTAYVIPQGIKNEERILELAECHAIGYYQLPKGSATMLRQYVKNEDNVELCEEAVVKFDNGAYVFPNTVPSTVLSVIMEPDFNTASGRKMSLLSMKLIEEDEDGYLPIYRYCHDLKDKKIEIDL